MFYSINPDIKTFGARKVFSNYAVDDSRTGDYIEYQRQGVGFELVKAMIDSDYIDAVIYVSNKEPAENYQSAIYGSLIPGEYQRMRNYIEKLEYKVRRLEEETRWPLMPQCTRKHVEEK